MNSAEKSQWRRAVARTGGRPPRWVAAAFLAVLMVAAVHAARTEPTIAPADPVRYLNDIKALTDPKMEGRGDDTKGISLAMQLLADRYKSLGLDPAGSQGFLQPFTVVTGAKMVGVNSLHEQVGGAAKNLKLDEDFRPFSYSDSGEVSAPLVFVGYGVTADESHYDDYSGIDAQGKIVVMLRYEPTSLSRGRDFTDHATFITKAINARNHGARAVIVINGQSRDPQQPDTLVRFGSATGPENAGVVYLQAKNEIAQAWFAAAGKSLVDLQKQINTSGKPASFAFPDAVHLSVSIHVEPIRNTVDNVLAYLPGQTNEYIVIGAHYDHLGYGHYDSLAPSQIGTIHPGADDNASGTAGVLELARLMAPLKAKLHRGILFSSYAGEELGLLGSADWVKNPTRPLGQAVAMINMDMIGRIKDEKVFVGGIGTGSTFAAVLADTEKGTNFHFESSFGGDSSSDHTSYVSAKIPALFFFSGLHSDYHRPSDTWDKINAPDAAHLLDMVAKVAIELDDESARPTFAAVAPQQDGHSGSATGGGGGGYGPYFGSVPDFGESTEHGVRFADVEAGSPAAKAGLKAGDILVHFGNSPVNNLYDFTDALRASKVGDDVQVTVQRDGKPLTVPVHLEARH
jgi:hypothetical protein